MSFDKLKETLGFAAEGAVEAEGMCDADGGCSGRMCDPDDPRANRGLDI